MIRIPRAIVEAIIAQARAELPNEACGLLTGVDGYVSAHYPMRNVDASPEHFSFDPREQFAVLRSARAEGQRIVANYHSHPSTPAHPSEEDIRLAFDPDLIYIIVSLAQQEPVVKAFMIQEGQASEIGLNIFGYGLDERS
ncbi:MAG: M67 family metallopeptidase [Rikenellaceae bacterium]|jgi:proteasome lid subunit RPN8/RPN11|nr:M67 family metallopeptidase [Rikenellaceae bacterium]